MRKTKLSLIGVVARTGLMTLLVGLSCGVPPRASAIGPGDADAAIAAFNKAFLVTSGSSAFYKKSLSDSKADGTWVASLDIMGEEDACERTGSAADKTLVNNLCATWLQQTPPGSATQPWKWDGWNDDIGWFTMALARGYQITGNADYLTQAENGFNYAFTRGWDTKWNNGGIWEQQIEYCKNGAHISKETLSNDSLGIVACLLYQSTHDAAYLDKAKQIYDWEWSHLYNAATGQVYTGVDRDGTVDHGTAVYNQGTFVDYANYLYQITGNANYDNDAKKAIDYTKNTMTTGGVISNSAGYLNTWADTFARGLGHFVRDNRQWGAYYPWMAQNANAAWGCRRTDDNIAWNGWGKQTPSDDSLATSKFVSAVAWLQFTPAAPPSAIGGAHFIVSRQNGLAIDNAGLYASPNGAPAGVVLWGLNDGQNQKWDFTQNADGSWNIVSQSSWQAMEDPGSATANGTQIVQGPPDRDANQRWRVAAQPDGSYKIWNTAGGLVLAGSRSSKNGQPLVGRAWNGGTAQRWILK